jgi:hypothetical protein
MPEACPYWCRDTAPPCPGFGFKYSHTFWGAALATHTTSGAGSPPLYSPGKAIFAAPLWQRFNLAPIFKGER